MCDEEDEEDEEEEQAIVIDVGSSEIRGGFAGDDSPRCWIPSVVGLPQHKNVMIGMAFKDYYIGMEAQSKRSFVDLKYPINKGIITDWDIFEKLLNDIFHYELRIESEEHPILLSESPFNTKGNKEKLIELIFETFNAPSYYTAIDAKLALYASGKINGIVIDTGYDKTNIVPIINEGNIVKNNIIQLEIGGNTLTNYMNKLLMDQSKLNNKGLDAEHVKIKNCYIADDYEKEIKNDTKWDIFKRNIYKDICDETETNVGDAVFKCPEILFNPSIIGMDNKGIHELVYDVIMKCDEKVRSDLYGNIILSGGSVKLSGFSNRIEKELRKMMKCDTIKLKTWMGRIPRYSVWNGGSIISSLSVMGENMWILKTEYDESGPSIVHRKCF